MNQYRVPHQDLKAFCRKVFLAFGVAEEAAQTVADNLVEAELREVKSHGVARVKGYAESLETKLFNAQPNIKIVRESASTLTIDGDFGLGAVIGKWAMEHCLEKAEKTGAAFAAVSKGRHFGIAGFYAMMALKRDMIGLAFCNSDYNMNVYGGTSRVLGTNPICIAVPAYKRYPLVFDAATSQAAFNKIRNAALEDRPIPAGWALGPDGKPTTDAKEALIGGVVHFGGYKGSGLAVMVQVLSGILSSAFLSATKDLDGKTKDSVGFFLGAIRIADFLPVDTFKQGVDDFIDHLKSSRIDENIGTIYMPGELEFLHKEENCRTGVKISQAVFDDLLSVQQKYNIRQPLNAVLAE